MTSCAFSVTVALAPKLAATSFLAFGNSITEGKTAFEVILSKNYPEDLRVLLASRYSSQTISMVNRGLGGETAAEGMNRISQELNVVRPEVLLLEEGINDLSDDPDDIPPMVDALAEIVQEARRRGIQVLIATLLPQRAGGSKALAVSAIPAANTKIREMAAYEGAKVVDLYQGFGGSPDPYISVDGLHPNEAGYQRIAQLFFDAIRANLELPQNAAAPIPFLTAEPFLRFR